MTWRTLLAVVCLGVVATTPDAFAGTFAQLSSTQTQKAGKGPKVVTLNSTDAAKGIENKNGTVVVKEAGTYFVMASGQLGGSGKGTVKLWLRHNGKDVDNSTNEQTVEPGSTSVLICQAVLELKAADKVELVLSASSPTLGLLASRPKGEPAITSVIFSALKVDGGPFAQLSSTQTQEASAKGKAVTLNVTNAARGVENQNGVITIKEAGLYFLLGASQAGATAKDGKGKVRLWARLNGKDIDNSNNEQSVANGSTAVFAAQGAAEMKVGDKVVLVCSASGAGVGLVASHPKGEPVVPSVIFTMFKVPGTTYAQLLSVKPQPAAEAGKGVGLEVTDAVSNVENTNGVVTIKESGTYFLMAAGQLAGSGKGTVKMWLRKNGKDLDNSNNAHTVEPDTMSLLVNQAVLELKAGDKLELVQSASKPGVGLVAVRPTGEPVCPSMIFSLLRVD